MRKTLLTLCISTLPALAESFINNYEYGEMLYKNPRGIGCDKCHGEKGLGNHIGSYTKNKKEYKIDAPNISAATAEEIKKSLRTGKKRNIMPEYFLTDTEIAAIVSYLKQLNTKQQQTPAPAPAAPAAQTTQKPTGHQNPQPPQAQPQPQPKTQPTQPAQQQKQ